MEVIAPNCVVCRPIFSYFDPQFHFARWVCNIFCNRNHIVCYRFLQIQLNARSPCSFLTAVSTASKPTLRSSDFHLVWFHLEYDFRVSVCFKPHEVWTYTLSDMSMLTASMRACSGYCRVTCTCSWNSNEPFSLLCILEESLEIYRSEPCLWNLKSKDCHRVEKETSYSKLVIKLKEFCTSADIANTVKKINNIHSYTPFNVWSYNICRYSYACWSTIGISRHT